MKIYLSLFCFFLFIQLTFSQEISKTKVVIDQKDPKKVLSKVKAMRKSYQKVKFCFDNKLGAYEYVKLR